MTHILWLSEPKEWQQNQNFHSLTVCWNRSGNKRFRLQKPPLCNYAITNHRIESVAHGGLQDREQNLFKSRYTVKLKVVTCKAAYLKNISCVFTSQTVTGCKNLWGKCIRSFDSLVVDMVAMIRTIMQEAAWTVCIKVMLSVFAFFFFFCSAQMNAEDWLRRPVISVRCSPKLWRLCRIALFFTSNENTDSYTETYYYWC